MEKNYVDILIVHAEGKDYAVEAPAFEAEPGKLAEFRVADRETLLGVVTNVMTCEKSGDAWNCILKLARIHEAVTLYDVHWRADA